MGHVILDAMKRLREYESSIGKSVSKPIYLLVQRYGRTLEPVLKETAEAFGKKRCFLLRKDSDSKGITLLEKLMVEARKTAEIGKRFDGLVLVELTGEEKEGERQELYEYIKMNSEEISCVFTVKNEEAAEGIYQELEQQFPFVRQVSEECYEAKEQKAILMEALEQGGTTLTEGAKEWIEEELTKVNWKPTDHVANKIKNMANNLIYEQIMKGGAFGEICIAELERAMKQQTTAETEKIPIGFAAPKKTEQDNKAQEKNREEMVA